MNLQDYYVQILILVLNQMTLLCLHLPQLLTIWPWSDPVLDLHFTWLWHFKPFRRYGVPSLFTCDLVLIFTFIPRPSKSKQFIFGFKYTNNQSLVKFRPPTIALPRPKCIFQHVVANHDLDLWPFYPKSWHVHPYPKVQQRWKFRESKSNTFQDIVLTMFGIHRQTQ